MAFPLILRDNDLENDVSSVKPDKKCPWDPVSSAQAENPGTNRAQNP